MTKQKQDVGSGLLEPGKRKGDTFLYFFIFLGSLANSSC